MVGASALFGSVIREPRAPPLRNVRFSVICTMTTCGRGQLSRRTLGMVVEAEGGKERALL
jgi:hypothetical protein